ncbi:restriction endonuclease subunit S [Vibrio sp. Vb1574]|uniref:restriction endonuclease subunit S n=1 Tax=Vibrio sp. Vb1574 TaxID=3074643 RepID=UPI0029654EE8|nr:restriction endonuclease subunit S [Vibrio sp. Vb1574]MDW1890717.1 restriction endonuclease subunit S [Vibrio sp. Vb1574]
MSWPLVKLTEVAEVNPRCPKDIDEDQIVSFVAMASASEEGLLLGEEPKVLKNTKKGFTYFERGDVLLAKITPCFENGKSLRPYQIKNQVGFGSTEFHVVRADLEKLDPTYLFYLLWNDAFRFLGTNAMAGAAGQKRVGTPFLKQLEIPLPPLDEQKRIAAILDKADAIRQKRKQAIELADEFLRSVFLDMFGDVSGVGESTVEKLAEDRKGSMRTGPFGSQLLHSEFTESGVSVLGIDNAVKNRFEWGKERFISQDKYSELSRYTVLPGDVLITIMGTCGRCAVVPEDIPVAINTKHLCCITLDKSKCLPEFLHSYFLYHPIARRYLEKNTKGAIMAGLNMGIVKAMPVPVFPLAMQNKYVEIAKKIESSRYNREEFETLGNRSFDSISQKAFSGQL